MITLTLNEGEFLLGFGFHLTMKKAKMDQKMNWATKEKINRINQVLKIFELTKKFRFDSYLKKLTSKWLQNCDQYIVILQIYKPHTTC
jgi:hypothetical protein